MARRHRLSFVGQTIGHFESARLGMKRAALTSRLETLGISREQ